MQWIFIFLVLAIFSGIFALGPIEIDVGFRDLAKLLFGAFTLFFLIALFRRPVSAPQSRGERITSKK